MTPSVPRNPITLGIALVVLLLVLSSLPASSAKTGGTRMGVENHTSSRASVVQAPALSVGVPCHQTNVLSDLPGVAFTEDPFLVNPWGAVVTANSPFWVVNNKRAYATLYQGDVNGSPLVRNSELPFVAIQTIPTVAAIATRPTAVVANSGDFVVHGGGQPPGPAHFIFASEWGIIAAWQPFFGSSAFVAKPLIGHLHTGLAIGNIGSEPFLYAADFRSGKIDVFEKHFNETTVPGNFAVDAAVPATAHPFNIQNIGGSLYVTYAEFNQFSERPNNGGGKGFVRKFDTNGVRDPAFVINNGVFDQDNARLAAPWGLALAPANFGAFSNKLLVGDFGSASFGASSVFAFDPATGAYAGEMVDEGGGALKIDRLWSLVFGNGTNGGDPNTLYFTAGIFSEAHGLFGSLKPVSGVTPSTVRFSSADYFASEGEGFFDVTVTRSGDVSGPASVNYATVDNGAVQSSDYEIALGKLTFAPGETSKTFRIMIVDDKLLAGGTLFTLNLVLSNASGMGLATPSIARLSIQDNEFDTPGVPPNASDDPSLFVRQQYYDFLNRVPDTAGFNFWVNQITSCGSDQQCIENKRINVSAAFFLSIEFQRTGMTAYLTHRLLSGRVLPRYGTFMRDLQALQKDYVFGAPGADAQLESNKQAFFNDFVSRPEFVARFEGFNNAQYVDTLLALRNVESNQVERDALVNGLDTGTETHATVLRKITENEAYKQRELNTAFVLMEYFGYLRRNPDDPPDNNFAGFNFWLNKLNSFNGDFHKSDMVKAFLRSTEYRSRFGPP